MKSMSNPKSIRLNRRSSGVLLHPTSLPGPHGCGDLGREAYRFVDFLAASGQRWWQMLPVGPVDDYGCPYQSASAFAGNPLLISLDTLVEDGLLARRDLKPEKPFKAERVDYKLVTAFRESRLRKAFAAFQRRDGSEQQDFRRFCGAVTLWLPDYARFRSLQRKQRGQPWPLWARGRRAPAMDELQNDIEYEQFVQYQFHRQWAALKRYCVEKGIGLLGDIPIFVSHDSADVWAHPELFLLDKRGRPQVVSGVPPDFFSKTGQLWGHPLYRWAAHRATKFAWWRARFAATFEKFDAVRIDHFLGFHRCWAVPGRAKTAKNGQWLWSPGRELFGAVERDSKLQGHIIAEDLGVLTPAAAALRDRFGFPGMRVLQFAFGDPADGRYHQPHNYPRNCVAYTGTHDNDTSAGWFEKARAASQAANERWCENPFSHRSLRESLPAARRGEKNRGKGFPRQWVRERILAPARERIPAPAAWGALSEAERALRYLGGDRHDIHWSMIRVLLASPADTVIFPMQDIFGLGTEARMNVPGTVKGNWQWRMKAGTLTDRLARRLRKFAEIYERI